MKNLILTLIFVTVNGAFADKAGNGQLLTRVDGQLVPIESARATNSRLYRGIHKLPDGKPGNGESPEFNRDYGESLKIWFQILKEFSPGLAKILEEVGIQKDIFYVNGEIVYEARPYPKGPINYKTVESVIYFNGKIYIPIPIMEQIGGLGNVTAKEHQGYVLLHELINATYVKHDFDTAWPDGFRVVPILSDEDRLMLGQMILEIKIRNWSPVRYLTETALENFSFWRMPGVTNDLKLSVLEELLKSQRQPWVRIFNNPNLKFIRELVELADKNKTIEAVVKNDDDFIRYLAAAVQSTQVGLRFPRDYGTGETKSSYNHTLTSLLAFNNSIRDLYNQGILKNLAYLQTQIGYLKTDAKAVSKSYEVRKASESDSAVLGEDITSSNSWSIDVDLGAMERTLAYMSRKFWESQEYSWLDRKTLEMAQQLPVIEELTEVRIHFPKQFFGFDTLT